MKYKKEIIMGVISGALLIFGVSLCLSHKTASVGGRFGDGGTTKVVIDVGHGGVDPGKVSPGGVKEKEINLQIAMKVKDILVKNKFEVVMTRTSDAAMYKETDTNKKLSDMKARVALIEEEKPVMTVSIHQNSFTSPSSHGAQVFYYRTSEKSKLIAETVQETLKEKLDDGNNRMAKANDTYYLLLKTTLPIVIVECGFLSNASDTEKLTTPEYQQQMAEAIVEGIKKSCNTLASN